jgi:hypothetical protein
MSKKLLHKIGIAVLLVMPMVAIAQVDDPAKFAELKLEGNCDANNHKLFVYNNHESKLLVITVRWNLFGSKRIITDKFQVVAVSRREIGCAAQADIVSAEFVAQ